MIHFCTLFDSNYLARGLALHESLAKTCEGFHLYVIAFDDNCFDYLSKANLSTLTPVKLKDFEDEKLLNIKSDRTAAEYCWTCTPSIILYCIEKYNLPSCTYIDADMIFYSNPQVLLDELDGCSILISPHRYTKDYDHAITHGIYCVQFMYFKNDTDGMLALRWWRERCIEWCHAYLEDGKFGDQKYLDDWPTRFRGVHILQHPGGGVAPWNVQQYGLIHSGDQIDLIEKKNQYPLVFYHFHGLKFFSDQKVSCCAAAYELTPEVKDLLYFPYIKRLLEIEKYVQEKEIHLNPNGAKHKAPSRLQTMFEFIKDSFLFVMKGKISLFDIRKFDFSNHNHFYETNQFI